MPPTVTTMTQGMDEEEHQATKRRVSVTSQDSSGSTAERCSRGNTPFHLRISPSRGVASAPHSRSSSVKRTKPRPRELDLITNRQRTNSMPTCTPIQLSISFEDLNDDREDAAPKLHRVRSFHKTSKGLVNRGDSVKRKNTNNVFAAGINCPTEQVEFTRDRTSSSNSQDSTAPSVASGTIPTSFRVVMQGAVGVGKTALTQQFMTSEYMGASDTTSAEGYLEKTVSVFVDGDESTVNFIDPPAGCVVGDDIPIDGYVVVFSVTDKRTFEYAVDVLYKLRSEQGSDRAVILVANKVDLVRKRLVTPEEAKSVATQYGCKYTETSAAINHQVDELLVGVVSQIRLKFTADVCEQTLPRPCSKRQKANSCIPGVKGARGLLNKILNRKNTKSKSCDNLYTL